MNAFPRLAARRPRTCFERFEYKYWVPEALAGEVARRARARLSMARSHTSTVTSLYLDTPDLCFLSLNSDEAHLRLKLRVRVYAPVGPAFLEIKRRFKSVVHKRRAMVARAALPDLLALRLAPRADRDQENAHLEAFLYLKTIHRAGPELLVRCLREACSPDEADGRLTIDREIVCQGARGLDLAGDPGAWRPVLPPGGCGDGALVELKFRDTAPDWIQDLAADLGPWRTSFSKYARGMTQRLHLRRDAQLQAVVPWTC